ncbi:MAG TPA: transcription antitermination factor NusB [Burkholderiaceae bacterium]|nr:transcription antitermination factor NusB [Burkholderiaceae bacterium]HPE00747.1 transcription antitermination factor NusB [Burkholderiaceae bacterium]HRZ00921.1 transcription antitermination factor NusB [Burkholderiaceae bacterium]
MSQPDTRRSPAGRSARRRAREFALQGLYQWLVGGADGPAIEAHMMEIEGFDKCDVAHFREVLHGAIDGADELRAAFSPFIDREVAALSPVEHAILLLGTYELRSRPEIPYRVVINESVELAKSFGGTDGFRYVNGVLDKVAGSLRPHEARAAR